MPKEKENVMDKRVAVVGMGIISPLGNSLQEYWKNLAAGVCGISKIDAFDTSDLPSKVGGTVKNFNPEDFGMEKSFIRKQDKFTLFALGATTQALKQSGLNAFEGGNIDPYRLGVNVSTGIGGYSTVYDEVAKMEKNGPKWVSPNFIPTMIPNAASGAIAIKANAYGTSYCLATACSSSTHAIGEAFRIIKHGYADAMITGGSEAAMIRMTVSAFSNMRALSRKEDPLKASLPFSADRDGFVMGEGAGILILEEYEHAKARGAEILAEIVGYGSTTDAYHSTAPRPDGSTQARAFSLALQEAGYKSGEPLYINSHGTGTPLNDSCETKAIKLALGEAEAHKAQITAVKSMTGHALGAAGGMEAIAAVLSLQNSLITPTIGLENPDPECDLNYTPLHAAAFDGTLALSDSLAFGGHNACIALRKV